MDGGKQNRSASIHQSWKLNTMIGRKSKNRKNATMKNSSRAKLQVPPPAPTFPEPPGMPANGMGGSWEFGGVVIRTPPAGFAPERAASRRRSGSVIDTVWFLVPSGSKAAASRNGSLGMLHQTF